MDEYIIHLIRATIYIDLGHSKGTRTPFHFLELQWNNNFTTRFAKLTCLSGVHQPRISKYELVGYDLTPAS